MQPETLNRSIQPTPTVHPRGFTPTSVQFWAAANTQPFHLPLEDGPGNGPDHLKEGLAVPEKHQRGDRSNVEDRRGLGGFVDVHVH